MIEKKTEQKLIYARYILPPILIFLLVPIAFIPSYRYVESGSARGAISLAALISNAWEQGREILFATSDATVAQMAYGRALVAIIIAAVVFYLISLAVAIWSCAVALKLFISDDEEGAERSRTLFITFFPNRIVLTVIEALALALALFPYLIPLVYAQTLGLNVSVVLNAPDGLIFEIVFIAAIASLSAITAPYERRFDADVFKKRVMFGTKTDESGGDADYESVFGTDGEQDERDRALKEEQAELIRKLLSKDKNEKD